MVSILCLSGTHRFVRGRLRLGDVLVRGLRRAMSVRGLRRAMLVRGHPPVTLAPDLRRAPRGHNLQAVVPMAADRLRAPARTTGVAVAAAPGHPVIGEHRVVVAAVED